MRRQYRIIGNAHYVMGEPKGSQFKNGYRNLGPLSDDPTPIFGRRNMRRIFVLVVIGFLLPAGAFASKKDAGQGAAASGGFTAQQMACFWPIAESVRAHTPRSISPGPGTARVTFHVHPGGRISVVAASGTTPEHASVARLIIAASRGPKSCGNAWLSQDLAFY